MLLAFKEMRRRHLHAAARCLRGMDWMKGRWKQRCSIAVGMSRVEEVEVEVAVVVVEEEEGEIATLCLESRSAKATGAET
jgi:hypothetical protein